MRGSRAMLDRTILRLLALEVRRARPVVLQTTALAAVALVVLALVGWLTPPRAGWILVAWSLAAPWSLPMSVLRDRLDGGLEFLQALPVSAGRLAAARLLAAVAFALPAGVASAVAFSLVRAPAPGPPDALRGGLLTFGLVTLAVASLAALGTGIALRLETRTFANGVGLAFVAVIAAHHLANRFLPGLEPGLVGLLGRPWVPRLSMVAAPFLAVALGGLGFHLARSGIERFTPGRDRVTW